MSSADRSDFPEGGRSAPEMISSVGWASSCRHHDPDATGSQIGPRGRPHARRSHQFGQRPPAGRFCARRARARGVKAGVGGEVGAQDDNVVGYTEVGSAPSRVSRCWPSCHPFGLCCAAQGEERVIFADGFEIHATIRPLRHRRSRIQFILGPVSERPEVGPPDDRTFHIRDTEEQIDMILNDGQQVAVEAVFVSRAGNPVPQDEVGTLTWEVSDPNVLTLQDNGDGTALVITTGVLGTASVTLKNDHDDDGTEDFQGSLAFDVVPGDVVGVEVRAGEPESRFGDAPQPEPTPEG